jgi:hypothetical protein
MNVIGTGSRGARWAATLTARKDVPDVFYNLFLSSLALPPCEDISDFIFRRRMRLLSRPAPSLSLGVSS